MWKLCRELDGSAWRAVALRGFRSTSFIGIGFRRRSSILSRIAFRPRPFLKCAHFADLEKIRSYCEPRDCDRLDKFCGATRMKPVFGLSISNIKKKATDTAIGRIRNKRRSV